MASPTFAFDPGKEPPIAPEPSPVAPARAAPAERPRVVPGTDVPNNLFSKIGLVLSNVGAGMAGQQLPTERMKQRMLQRQQIELQTMSAGISAMKTGAAIMATMPADQQQEFATQFAAQLESTSPGMAKAFESMAAAAGDRLESALNLFGDNADLVASVAKNADEALSWYTDPNKRKILEDRSDKQHLPTLGDKLTKLMGAVQQNWQDPEFRTLFNMVPSDAEGRPVVTEGNLRQINSQLPEGHALKLSDQELDAYRRNPGGFTYLGIQSQEIQTEAMKRALFPKLDKTKIVEDGKNKIAFHDETGRLVRKVDVGDVDPDPGDLENALLARSLVDKLPQGIFSPELTDFVNSMPAEKAAEGLVDKTQEVPPEVLTGRKAEEKAVVSIKEALARDKGNFVNTSNILRQVQAADPRTFGVVGTVSDWTAGWIGQISPDLANGLVSWATGGMSAGELKKLRTKLRTFIADNIKVVTGEESGKITKAELELTERATAALDAGASKDSVVSAITAITMLQDLTIRENEYFIGVDEYDIISGSLEERNKKALAYNQHLRDNGISSKADREYMLSALQELQGELRSIRIGAKARR